MHARVLANHQRLLGTNLRASGGRRLVGIGLAVLVHLVTAFLVVTAAWIWTTRVFPVAKVIGSFLLLAIAWEVRPRLGRLPKGANVLSRTSAPSSFAVLDEVARTTGSRPPDLLVVTPQFNASVSRASMRGRHVFFIGLPLWEALDDHERLAVLGHECGHVVNGDIRSTLIVGTAIQSLHRWAGLLRPDTRATRRRWRYGARGGTTSLFIIAEFLVPLALLPLSLTVAALAVGLERIAARSGQRAEYRADELAAAVASTEAAVSALDGFFAMSSCLHAMLTAVRADRKADVWEAERRFLASVTPGQRERWRRMAAREQHRTDASHPPTLLRLEMLRSRPPRPGAADVAPELLAAMTHELTTFEPMMTERLRDAATPL